MTIIPDHPDLREFLTLHHREMVKEKGKTTFENRKTPMFGATTVEGKTGLITYQGFWYKLREEMISKGHRFDLRDARIAILPMPNLRAAMVGLRPIQKPWIMQALMRGDSGLIGGPTRVGKSYGMTAICRAWPDARIVVTAPGVDLCSQLYDHFKDTLPHRDVKGVYSGSRNHTQSPEITICSMDSLDKMDHDDTDILIIDEPHASVSETRLPRLAKFNRTRKYGFGATLTGRFDKKDRLIEGVIGPVIANITYREAVDKRAIAPLKVIIIKIPFSKDTVPGPKLERNIVYQRLLTRSSRAAALVRKIIHEVIPLDWQTMAFIQDEKQAEYYMEHAMPVNGTIAMAKRMPKVADRKAITAGIASGETKRVLASNIYVQGVTFPDLRVVLNLAGGGANTTAIQKPGRLLQTRPHKNYGVMFDFMLVCRDEHTDNRSWPPYKGVCGECEARIKAYENIGYDVIMVENAAEARDIVMGAYAEGK